MPDNPVPKKNPDLWTAEFYEALPTYVKQKSLGNTQTFNVITLFGPDNNSRPIISNLMNPLVPDKIYIMPSGGVGYIGPPMNAVYPIANMTSQLIEKTDLNQIWYVASGVTMFVLYYGAPSITTELQGMEIAEKQIQKLAEEGSSEGE